MPVKARKRRATWRWNASSTSSNPPCRRHSRASLRSAASRSRRPSAGCRLLRHPERRTWHANRDHAAPPHRWCRRRLAPEVAGRAGRPHRDPRTAGRRRRRRGADRVAGCGAGDRSRPSAGAGRADHHAARNARCCTATTATALAEFCNDHVTAWSTRGCRRTAGAEQQWREWELELAEADGRRRHRPVEPVEQPAARCRCRARRSRLEAGAGAGARCRTARRLARPTRCTARWPSRSRSCWCGIAPCGPTSTDSVHQMRVTTRKIRSLLQDAQRFVRIADDAWILDELRELAGVLGVARDAEVLAERYQHAAGRAAAGAGARTACGSVSSREPGAATRPGCGDR